MLILGIDPGLKGALALIDGALDTRQLDISLCWDMPSPYTPVALAQLLRSILSTYPISHVAIEQVGSRPHQAGGFNFGFSTGMIYGAMAALYCTPSVPLQIVPVPPSVWKPALGLTHQSKSASIALVKELCPAFAERYLTLKKHDGRAEAFLLAYFAWKKNLFASQG